MSFLPEVATLIDEFNNGPLRVNRPGPKARNAFGGFDDAAVNLITLNPVHVYPVTGDELDLVPEASREKAVIALVSRQRLISKETGQVSDRVEYKGDSYRVIKTEDRDDHGSAFISFAEREESGFPP